MPADEDRISNNRASPRERNKAEQHGRPQQREQAEARKGQKQSGTRTRLRCSIQGSRYPSIDRCAAAELTCRILPNGPAANEWSRNVAKPESKRQAQDKGPSEHASLQANVRSSSHSEGARRDLPETNRTNHNPSESVQRRTNRRTSSTTSAPTHAKRAH